MIDFIQIFDYGFLVDPEVRDRTARDGRNVALVHDLLRAAILRGDLAPGTITSQVALARSLGVSRTPLREALRLLQREGLILAEANRRVRIADFTIADVEELYLMRIALEAVAIRITVPTLTPEDFAELEGLMAQMDHYMRRDDFDRMDVPHRAFHARFVSGAGSRVAATIGQLFDHAQRYRRAYGAAVPDGWPVRRAEHRAMLDAAAAGDIDLTVERMAVHYARTARLALLQLNPSHDPVLLRTALATVVPRANEAIGLLSRPEPLEPRQ
ncbi:MAG TPA: GntR family transcriptional regulator [Candidatus Dormibacteraeota bacterium]|nr:GntR family transcriptional regulator [Candidatus Dormibacteraeota bacterium]